MRNEGGVGISRSYDGGLCSCDNGCVSVIPVAGH